MAARIYPASAATGHRCASDFSQEFFYGNIPVLNRSTLHALPENPIDTLWTDKPVRKLRSFVFTSEFHGRESADKRSVLADQIKEQGADALLLTKADSICWLLIFEDDIPVYL